MLKKVIIAINETWEQEISIIENPNLAKSNEWIDKSLLVLFNLKDKYDEIYLILVDTKESLETLQKDIETVNNYKKNTMQFSDFEPVTQDLICILEENKVTWNWKTTYFTQIS